MTYQPPPAGAPAQDPGRTLGIVGLILAIFCNLIGMIVSIIAYTRSKNAGVQEQHRPGRHHRRSGAARAQPHPQLHRRIPRDDGPVAQQISLDQADPARAGSALRFPLSERGCQTFGMDPLPIYR